MAAMLDPPPHVTDFPHSLSYYVVSQVFPWLSYLTRPKLSNFRISIAIPINPKCPHDLHALISPKVNKFAYWRSYSYRSQVFP